MTVVDLNSDLGEGFGSWQMGDDLAMLDIVTSANVACGYHAGDPTIMRRMCVQAAARGVAIGAHVSYPDRQGFGRRQMDMSHDELADAVLYQLGALQACAHAAGATVTYVKPHGALYNTIVHDVDQARAVIAGVAAWNPTARILGLPGSKVLTVAVQSGLIAHTEGFPDRSYNADGTLMSRLLAGAVLHDPLEIATRALRMVQQQEVVAHDGVVVSIRVDSLCVHGDNPAAVAIANQIRTSFEQSEVVLKSFVT